MNTVADHLATSATQPLLPALARFAVAVAVGFALTAAWISAETQSRHAVDTSELAISPNVLHVQLPGVQVVGHRNAKGHAA